MSSQPHPSQTAESSDLDARLTPYLFDLLQVGAAVAQGIKRQAEQPTRPFDAPDIAEQFERVSRAMRRTILLIRHIAQPGPPTSSTEPSPIQARTQARKQIIRAVEDTIQRQADPAEAEPLQAESRERLDSPDLDDEIANRPVAEIVKDIVRDLGLAHMPGTHPWTRRTPQDIHNLQTRAAAPQPSGP